MMTQQNAGMPQKIIISAISLANRSLCASCHLFSSTKLVHPSTAAFDSSEDRTPHDTKRLQCSENKSKMIHRHLTILLGRIDISPLGTLHEEPAPSWISSIRRSINTLQWPRKSGIAVILLPALNQLHTSPEIQRGK